MPVPNLGEIFPNFKAKTTEGDIQFHDWIGSSWTVLFTHPADYTPVCTSELARLSDLVPEFMKRGVKVIALSCDSVESHQGWSNDILKVLQDPTKKLPYALIGDEKRDIAFQLGMIGPAERDSGDIPLTVRAVYVIGPDLKLKLSFLYPATTGHSYEELLRVIDSLQITENYKVATPVDWTPGKEVYALPNVSDEEASKLFPKGLRNIDLPSGKTYMRMTYEYTK